MVVNIFGNNQGGRVVKDFSCILLSYLPVPLYLRNVHELMCRGGGGGGLNFEAFH